MTATTHPPHQGEAWQRAREMLAFGSIQRPPPEELDNREIWWCNRYEQLKARGYILRPRYAPNWIPSWKNDEKKDWADCEDSKQMAVGRLHTWYITHVMT